MTFIQKQWLRAVFTIMLVCLIAAPAVHAEALKAFSHEKGQIRISGGTAHIPVMKEVAQKIMSANPDIHISVAGGGSGVGIKQVGEGLVDIGNSGRTPTTEEIAAYGLELHKWAIDGVGIVTNPQNKVNSLTTDQLKDVFSGKITNWKTLGGEDKTINLYTRDESSGTREVFFKKAIHKGEISPKANVVVSNGAMKTAVANDPYSIGYVSVGHMDPTVQAVTIDGVMPTIETVKNGQYKVARGLFSNTKGAPQGLTKKFIDYLYTKEGQTIISAKGFIPTN